MGMRRVFAKLTQIQRYTCFDIYAHCLGSALKCYSCQSCGDPFSSDQGTEVDCSSVAGGYCAKLVVDKGKWFYNNDTRIFVRNWSQKLIKLDICYFYKFISSIFI